MLRKEFLQKLDIGNPVAEFDHGLSSYFFATESFNKVISGKADMVSGGKGTGKSAIYQYIQQCKITIPELTNVHIIPGINPTGEPLFRRLGEEKNFTEGEYVTIWKLYFISLIANFVIRNFPRPNSKNLIELESILSGLELLSSDSTAGGVFVRLLAWLREQAQPKAVGVDFTINEYGFPVITPKVELGPGSIRPANNSENKIVSHKEVFQMLESVLSERDIKVWVIMDRLDESFIGRPDVEIPALRALVRTFMDLTEYKHIHVKLFVRTDLFRKITKDGFVNLTHVNARKIDIIWDNDDLYSLLIQRIKNNNELLRYLGLIRASDPAIFRTFFVNKIDPNRGQNTWTWMLSQIRDGSDIKAPRNLIDLCILAQEEQLRKESRNPIPFDPAYPLIEADSLKKAAIRLSKNRIEDTLLAEYANDIKVLINAFRNGKSEHNDQSISNLFHVEIEQARLYSRALVDIGFFEPTGNTYKIPFLYRAGLDITQGKAFNGYVTK
jgi:hypothetical protein